MQAKNLGIVLIVIGLTMMIYTGFDLITTKNVVDLGPIQIDKNVNHPVQWSPIIGAILLIGGVAILLTNKRKIV